MTAQSDIAELYVGYFDRAPDPAGLAYWTGRYSEGMTLAEIAQSFSVQSESRAEYSYLANPDSGSAAEFINEVYNNLFGRDVEPAGLNYWLNDLQNGVPAGHMVLAMIKGATGADAIAVQNQVSVGLYYSDELTEHNKAWSPESAVSVIDEVNADSATVADGYYEVDQYIENGAINPPPLDPNTPLNPDWPPIDNLPDPIGPTVGDVLGTVNDLLNDASNLDVGGLLGNLLGNVVNLTGNLEDNVGNIVGFESGLMEIDLSDLNLTGVTDIAELGDLSNLGADDIFDSSPIVRGLLNGESLIVIDSNSDNVLDGDTDIQLLGLADATINDFIL